MILTDTEWVVLQVLVAVLTLSSWLFGLWCGCGGFQMFIEGLFDRFSKKDQEGHE